MASGKKIEQFIFLKLLLEKNTCIRLSITGGYRWFEQFESITIKQIKTIGFDF